MAKIYFSNLLNGILLMLMSAAIGSGVIALLNLFVPSLGLITLYVIGCIIGLCCGVLLDKFFIRKYRYFSQNELTSSKIFWINRINAKKFVKRGEAYLSFLPNFLLFVGSIVLAILVYTDLSIALNGDKWYAIVGVIIGTSITSSITYCILGVISFRVCKKCSAVNGFIYDETADCETISDMETKTDIPSGSLRTFVKQNVRSYGGSSDNYKDSFIGYESAHSERTVDTSTEKVICHCACCGEKLILNEKTTIYGEWNRS